MKDRWKSWWGNRDVHWKMRRLGELLFLVTLATVFAMWFIVRAGLGDERGAEVAALAAAISLVALIYVLFGMVRGTMYQVESAWLQERMVELLESLDERLGRIEEGLATTDEAAKKEPPPRG